MAPGNKPQKGNKNSVNSNLSSAVQALQGSVGGPPFGMPDDLDIPGSDDSEAKKTELLMQISDTIKKTLDDLREKGKQGLSDYIFEEKIALLERTKKAVEAFLIQILSSSNATGKQYEALSMIIKVNSELLKDLSDGEKDPNKPSSGNNNNPKEDGTTIIIAPSESMLDAIHKRRHSDKNISKNKLTTVDDNNQ